MTAILEFNELDDYLAHLREEQDTAWTHLEIGHVTSERDAHGIRTITFFAIATRRFLAPAEYIVVWSYSILHATSIDLEMDKHAEPNDQIRSKLHANFEKVKGMFEERKIRICSGKWSSLPPEYLG